MVEEWRPVVTWQGGVKYDYTGIYEVSNLGNVRSLDRYVRGRFGKKLIKGKVLKSVVARTGYSMVSLWKEGKHLYQSVHRMVWEAFNGKIPDGMQINHIDENKLNPDLSNLELVTSKENNNWGTHTSRMMENRKGRNAKKPIVQYDLDGNFLKEWGSSMDIEKELNYLHNCVRNCCNGKFKQAYGYIWRYRQ